MRIMTCRSVRLAIWIRMRCRRCSRLICVNVRAHLYHPSTLLLHMQIWCIDNILCGLVLSTRTDPHPRPQPVLRSRHDRRKSRPQIRRHGTERSRRSRRWDLHLTHSKPHARPYITFRSAFGTGQRRSRRRRYTLDPKTPLPFDARFAEHVWHSSAFILTHPELRISYRSSAA